MSDAFHQAERPLRRFARDTNLLIATRPFSATPAGDPVADAQAMPAREVSDSPVGAFSAGTWRLKDSEWRDATWADIRIGTLDVSMGRIENLTIRGGTVDALLTDDARMKRIDVSGTALHAVGHPGSLRGLVVSPAQMFDMAEALATHLGNVVRAEHE